MTSLAMQEVLTLFLVPIGGGIPAGVLVARARGIAWPLTMLLYLVSDVILACLFEPLMRGFLKFGKRVPSMVKFAETFKRATQKTIPQFGSRMGPLALVAVAFGADPMTGRIATAAAGHGFVTGWLIAILGDMIYFTVLMVATLWLQDILGDGTWTMIIILALMIGVPALVRRYRRSKQPGSV